jgi:hypothetical protein
VFGDSDTAVASDEFRNAFKPGGLATLPRYRYHLWTLRSAIGQNCVGMASFLKMPSAGFGGYLGYAEEFRGKHRLRQLVARVEEQFARDRAAARTADGSEPAASDAELEHDGWYIECSGEFERLRFVGVGFWELDVQYQQPCLPGKSAEPQGRCMHLLYKPLGRVYEKASIPKDTFLQAVREIYASVYRISDPDQDKTFGQLVKSLDGVPSIEPK